MCKFEKKGMYCSLNLDYKCLKPDIGIYHLEDAVRDGNIFHLGRFFQKSGLGRPQKNSLHLYKRSLKNGEVYQQIQSLHSLFPTIVHTINFISLMQEN